MQKESMKYIPQKKNILKALSSDLTNRVSEEGVNIPVINH
jgi:hypothetical protein